MTHWIDFFRIMAISRNRRGDLPLEPIAAFDDASLNSVARNLEMISMPTGHPIGVTDEALEWREDYREKSK